MIMEEDGSTAAAALHRATRPINAAHRDSAHAQLPTLFLRLGGALQVQCKRTTAQGAAREGANPSLRALPRHSLRTSSTSACGRRLIAAANCPPVIDCSGKGGRVRVRGDCWRVRGGKAGAHRDVCVVDDDPERIRLQFVLFLQRGEEVLRRA